MNSYTVVFEVDVEASDPTDAVVVARSTHSDHYRAVAIHEGRPDGVNPPLIPCVECGQFFDVLKLQEVDDESFMCLPCHREYTA